MLRSRILTAIALAAVGLSAILLPPPWVTTALLALILIIGSWEWSAFLDLGATARTGYAALLLALSVAGYRYALQTDTVLPVAIVGVIWWLVAFAWIVWLPSRVARLSAGMAGILALLPTWVLLLRIDQRWPRGAQWVIFVLALAFIADTGAFFVGRVAGRRRLAPAVSPNKTWEGVLGGLALAGLTGLLGAWWFGEPRWPLVALSLVVAAFSVIGDLTESLLKRHVRLKDSGRLFPGHGGVLDRIDSVTAATPVATLGLAWLGVGH